MMNIGDLYGTLSLNTANFTGGINSAIAQTQRLGVALAAAVGSKYNEVLSEANAKLEANTKKLDGYFKSTSRIVSGILIAQAFYRGLQAIESAANALHEFNMELETSQLGFEIMMRSAEKARDFMVAMQITATETPFQFQDVERMSRRLMALGFNERAVIPVIRDLSDMASVTGATEEQLDRITRAFGQIMTKGRLMQQELNQLTEAYMPAFKILQEQLGLTKDQMAEIGQQNIPAEKAIKALLRGIEKEYQGASKRAIKTLPGILSNIKDNALLIGNVLTLGIYNAEKKFFSGIGDMLSRAVQGLRKNGVSGMIEAAFPKSMVPFIKLFMLEIRDLAVQLGALFNALKPLGAMILNSLLRTTTLVLPVINMLVRIFKALAQMLFLNVPWVRKLAEVFVQLLIAGVAAMAVQKLFMALRSLLMLAPLVKMLEQIYVLVRAIAVFLLLNPLGATIFAIAAAILTLAITSEKASRWLDALLSRLTAFTGKTFNGLFSGGGSNDIDAIMKKYDSGLASMLSRLGDVGSAEEDVGDSAEEAGKKAKDAFEASFDELYQVPDKLGKTGSGLGNLFDEVPETPSNNDTGSVGMPDWLSAFKRNLEELQNMKFPPFVIPFEPPKPPPGAFAEDLEEAWRRIKETYRQWTEQVQVWRQRFGVAYDNVLEKINWLPNKAKQGMESLGEAYDRSISRLVNFGVAVDRSISGAWNSAKSGVSNVLAELDSLWTRSISSWNTKKQEWSNSISEWFGDRLQGVQAFAASIGPILVGLWIGLVTGLGNVTADVKNGLITLAERIGEWFGTEQAKAIAAVALVVAGIVAAVLLLPEEIITGLAVGFAALVVFVAGSFTKVKVASAAEVDKMKTETVNKFNSISDAISNVLTGLRTALSNKWKGIKDDVRTHVNGIIDILNRLIKGYNSIKFSVPSTTVFGKKIDGWSLGVPQVSTIPHFGNGALVTKSTTAQIAEKGEPEGVFPLNTTTMRPFAQLIAQEMGNFMPQENEVVRPILYVGTLIADDKSLKQLKRKMDVMGISESNRILGGVVND